MEPPAAMGCVNIGSLTSTLPVIPYQKLTDLYYLSRGGFGTVFKAQHSDWRTTVAIKCLKLDSPVGERYSVWVGSPQIRPCTLSGEDCVHFKLKGTSNQKLSTCYSSEKLQKSQHPCTARHQEFNLFVQ